MALLESVTCGNTEIAAHDIRIAVKKLAAVNPKTKTSGLASEYQVGIANTSKYEEHRNAVVCLCAICIACARNGVLTPHVFLGSLEVSVSERVSKHVVAINVQRL